MKKDKRASLINIVTFVPTKEFRTNRRTSKLKYRNSRYNNTSFASTVGLTCVELYNIEILVTFLVTKNKLVLVMC